MMRKQRRDPHGRFQSPPRIRDLAGVPIEEQRKIQFLMISSLDRMDTSFLVKLMGLISEELENRRMQGEPLGVDQVKAILKRLLDLNEWGGSL